MTNQELFTRITDNQRAINRLESVTDRTQHSIDYAIGTLLHERDELLALYGEADMIIWSCLDSSCHHCPVWTRSDAPVTNPKFNLNRLLANGQWQSEAERQGENMVRLEGVRG